MSAGRPLAPSVRIDVTEARAGAREAISVAFGDQLINPGEARRLADELTAAAEFVDQLAPQKHPTTEEKSNA